MLGMPSINQLTERKQKYVRARSQGLSQKRAALRAGYSERVAANAARNVETDDVKAVFAEIVARAASMDAVADTLVAGLKATETKLAMFEGKFTDERTLPDYGKRLAYAEVIAEYAGYVSKDAAPAQHLHMLTMMPGPAQASDAIPTPPIDIESKVTS
jgi:hypothetical protein